MDEGGDLALGVHRQIGGLQVLEIESGDLARNEVDALLQQRLIDAAGVGAQRLEIVEFDRHRAACRLLHCQPERRARGLAGIAASAG